LIFVLSVWIGVISAQHDPKFVRIILGNDYVDMTLDNMSKGDPLGVYKGDNQFVMFLQIALNNSRVALFCMWLEFWAGLASPTCNFSMASCLAHFCISSRNMDFITKRC